MPDDNYNALIPKILELVGSMSDNIQGARNVAAATGGRYIGSAVNSPSMGFMTFDGKGEHDPLQVTPQRFANQLFGIPLAPMLNDMLASQSKVDPKVLYAENDAGVKQAAMMNSIAKVMAKRVEDNLDIKDGTALARVMTSQFFSGPMTEEKLQSMSRYKMDQNEELRQGMLETGISTIGLRQYGLIGSLTNQDKLEVLKENVEKTAENSPRLGTADALEAAMTLGDSRLGLNISDEAKGYGDAGADKLAGTAESLKRAKELTGMGNRQTLGLLAEVYDNVIEGVLPDLDKFIDRMMDLERQGVSVTEFSSAVQSMRGRLGRAGVRDSEVAVNVVENALGARDTAKETNWHLGNTRFNQRQYEGNQIEREAKIATSNAVRVLGTLATLSGADTEGKDAAENFNNSLKEGISKDLPPSLQKAVQKVAAGELSWDELFREVDTGEHGSFVMEALKAGIGASAFAMKNETLRNDLIGENVDYGRMTALMPDEMKEVWKRKNNKARSKGSEHLVALTGFFEHKNAPQYSPAEIKEAEARFAAEDAAITKAKEAKAAELAGAPLGSNTDLTETISSDTGETPTAKSSETLPGVDTPAPESSTDLTPTNATPPKTEKEPLETTIDLSSEKQVITTADILNNVAAKEQSQPTNLEESKEDIAAATGRVEIEGPPTPKSSAIDIDLSHESIVESEIIDTNGPPDHVTKVLGVAEPKAGGIPPEKPKPTREDIAAAIGRNEYMEKYDIVDNGDGTFTAGTGSSAVTLSEKQVTSMMHAGAVYAFTHADIGTPEGNTDNIKAASSLQGLSKNAQGREADLVLAEAHIKTLAGNEGDRRRTKPDTMLAVMLDAAVSAHGVAPDGQISDFQKMINSGGPKYGEEQLKPSSDKAIKMIKNNDYLKDLPAFSGLSSESTVIEFGDAWEKQMDITSGILSSDPDKKAKDSALLTRNALQRVQERIRFGGGQVESVQEKTTDDDSEPVKVGQVEGLATIGADINDIAGSINQVMSYIANSGLHQVPEYTQYPLDPNTMAG